MKFKQYLIENKYNNWIRYTPESLKWDFAEYKKKELSKWNNRADMIGARFPLFESIENFKFELDNAKVLTLSESEANKIPHIALTSSFDELESMVGSYKRPRDIDRIIKGFESNTKLPMPIILKGNRGKFIMAGNTRLNVAFLMNIKPKVLEVNIPK